MSQLVLDANAVLLPAIDNLELTPALEQYFSEGGKTLLLGENRAEYVARKMSERRCQSETTADFAAFASLIHKKAGGAIIALDQEPAGILRLHGMVPQIPGRDALLAMSDDEIYVSSLAMAKAARALGVTMFLSPVVDVITGNNPWLQGRTLADDPAHTTRIASTFIKGVEAAGVITVAKHFPGHPDIDGDPATDIATVTASKDDIDRAISVFAGVIAAGPRAIMTGPALVPAMDADMPSSLSEPTISALKKLGFAGLVVSDDLDAPATLRDRFDVPGAAIAALKAGSDLLLLSAANDLPALNTRICQAVENGDLPAQRLADAANRVRKLAGQAAAQSAG